MTEKIKVYAVMTIIYQINERKKQKKANDNILVFQRCSNEWLLQRMAILNLKRIAFIQMFHDDS